MANTIASELQLTTILDAALTEFERHILPLQAFSTVFADVTLNGDGTVTVPYYPLENTASGTRAEGEAYSTKVSDTETQAKQITPNKNKIQGISFTPEQVSRQPQLNLEKHGARKGQKLAYDIIKDIFSVVRRSNFTGTTLSAITPSAFDNDDIRNLRKLCNTDKWPMMGRSCWLDSELYSEVLGDQVVLDLSQSGTRSPLLDGVLPNMFGFAMGEALGMHTNDGTATALTSVTHGSDLFTLTGHDLVDGDIVQFAGTTLPTGLTAATDYFVRDATANTFKVAATSGGAAVAISDNGTAPTVQRFERLGGFVAYESAILTAFAPVPPTAGIRQHLIDYRQVRSASGLVLEYKHLADADKSIEYQIIECHYGYAVGQAEALKRIFKAA